MRLVRGCLAQIGCLTLVIAIAIAAWVFRGPLLERAQRLLGRPARLAPVVVRVESEVADSVESKVRRFLRPAPPVGELWFTASEVQSWVKYRVEPALPSYVHDLRVALAEADLSVEARVETRRVPRIEALGRIAGFLADTTDVRIVGRLDGIGRGRGALFVDRLYVAGVPLPDPVRDRLLAALLGRSADPRLPPHAIAFPLPAGVIDIAVREGAVVVRGAGDAR